MRKTCAVLCLLVGVQPVWADEYNPFLGRASKGKPAHKEKAVPVKVPGNAPVAPPLPPLAVPPPPQMVLRHDGRQTAVVEKVSDPKPFVITGRIGDLVSITEMNGRKAVVQDGTMRSGCFVKYPEAVCEEGAIAQAKREFAESRGKSEAQATENAPAIKARDTALELSKVRADLAVTTGELAKHKAELVSSRAEASTAKAQAEAFTRQISRLRQANTKLEEDNTELARQLVDASQFAAEKKAQLEDLGRQLARMAEENKRLMGVNAELAKGAADATKERATAAGLQKKLEDSRAKEAKALKDLADLRSTVDAPPTWVKGTAKHYNDPALGDVIVTRTEKQVFFRVARVGEDPADKLFGNTVVRKERKGDFTYYALNAHNVRVKEQ